MTVGILPLPKARPEWLIGVAMIALALFYYFARADAIGTGEGTVWETVVAGRYGAKAHFALSALLLGVGPALLARRLTGLSWSALGLGLGNWRVGLRWFAVGLPLVAVAGWIGAQSPEMRAVYPLDRALTTDPERFLPHALTQFLYFGAWEVLFRGVLLFGLAPRLGAGTANLVQTALSVTAHFGRPMDETLSAIPAGLVFGVVGLQVGSIWYVAVLHWGVGVLVDLFILISPG